MFEPRVELTRLEKEVINFEKKPIEKRKILFYGSSGFTRWSTKWGNRDLEEDIRMADGSPAAINHGFGGASAEELLYYYPRLVKPWEPRALVVSIIHNDRGLGYSINEIMTNLAKLLEYARTDFPGIRLYLCDARPTLKLTTQAHLLYHQEFHQALKEYCGRHPDTTLISHMGSPLWVEDPKDLGDRTKVRKDIFVEDELHFNQTGYDLYKIFMTNVLKDIL